MPHHELERAFPKLRLLARVALLASLLSPRSIAQEWSQFRGPNGSGVSEATGLPVEFGAEKNLLWKVRLPPGHSSPVVAGDRVVVTAWEGDRLITLCLSRETGAVLWRRELPRGRSEHLHKNNSPASPSPATDGSNVYSFFGDFGVISYTLEGKERWRLPLGPFRNYKGMGASPVLAGGALVLLCDQDVGSFLLALDKDTGAVRWRTERAEIPGNGHATPVVYEDSGGTMLVVLGASRVTGYQLDSGERVWWVGGLSIQPKSSPIVARDPDGRATVYILAPGSEEGPSPGIPPFSELVSSLDKNGDGRISGSEVGNYIQADADGDGVLTEAEYNGFMSGGAVAGALLAIRPAGRGDLTGSGVLWRFTKALPVVPSPLLYQGVLYLLKEGGIVTALDPATGAVLSRVRLHGALDNYFASPIAADGNLYMVSQSGHVAVLKAGRVPELLAVNDLDDECFATPAVAPGRLYVRSRSALYCFTRRGR